MGAESFLVEKEREDGCLRDEGGTFVVSDGAEERSAARRVHRTTISGRTRPGPAGTDRMKESR
ncbi:hypothetical protein ACVH9Z_28590 [Rhodococcus opacus]|uniref:hypothetical protein n=1 Tax=Rhodococcus opacus TaxID=37919 RepID=UPI0006BB4B6D|nr:hypothetical protein [Rhodococcus opacus]MDJ0420258.1 hypothetical protein [Rhodococcus opacus]